MNVAIIALASAVMGALVMLFGVFIAERNGRSLFAVAKEEHDLNRRIATPIIGSIVRLEPRQVLPSAYRPFHFIITTIHNDGSLAAQKIKGNWRVYSPTNCINEVTIPIVRDALGPPYQAEEQLIGNRIDEALRGNTLKVTINVDVEFDYFGISPNDKQHYSAHYQYDEGSRQMVQVSDTHK